MSHIEQQRNIPAGVWLSTYRYTSSGRKETLEDKHYVRLYHEGRHIIVESIPKVNKSYVLIRMSVDGNIATGTWQEETNPEGYYKGAIYTGGIQLVIDEDGKHMDGKWVGFGKGMEVNTGPWSLAYIGKVMPENSYTASPASATART